MEKKYTNYNDYRRDKEAERELNRRDRIKGGLKAIAVISIGAGLYGFKLGRRSGYRKGVKDGYVHAGEELIEAWKQHTEEMLRSRKGD